MYKCSGLRKVSAVKLKAKSRCSAGEKDFENDMPTVYKKGKSVPL